MADRLGPYDALGVTFELHAHRSVAGILAEAFADLRTRRPAQLSARIHRSVSKEWTIRLGDEVREIGNRPDMVLYEISMIINEWAAASAAPTGAVLHGSAVEIAGQGVALVGPSGAGKSTLAAGLLRKGAGFICEEVCAVSPDGLVQPYHRPIGLRRGGAEVIGVPVPDGPFDRTYPWRGSAHGARLSGAVPLAAVVLVTRRPGAPDLAPIDPPEALYILTGQTLGGKGVEREMFRSLDRLVRVTPIYALSYAEWPQAAQLVESILS